MASKISLTNHIGGRRELIAPLCQQAMDLGMDGLIIESHCDPEKAWSDAKQQITPDMLDYILSLLVIRDKSVTTEVINEMRKQMFAEMEEKLFKDSKPEDSCFYYHSSEDRIVLSHALFWVMTQVFREHSRTNKFLLQDLHEVEQVLGTVVTYIIYLIGRDGKAVLAILLLWSMMHDTDNTFYNVVNKSEVTLAVAIIKNLDSLAFNKLVGETEVCHVRTTSRTVNSEEAQSCRRYVVKLAIGMSHKLVALLGGCIKRYRVVNLVVS